MKITFIFGAPRSGTTWLWSLLESNVDVVPFIDGIEKDETGKYPTSESRIYKKNSKIAHSKISNFSALHPEKRIIEKTPIHVFSYDKIISDFPESENIVIFRHPIAILNSILQSNMCVFKNSTYYPSIKLIKNYYKQLDKIGQRSDINIVVYEKLLNNTLEQLNTLCSNLKIDTTQTADIILENTNKSKVNVQGVYRKGIANSFYTDMTYELIQKTTQDLSNEIRIYKAYQNKTIL